MTHPADPPGVAALAEAMLDVPGLTRLGESLLSDELVLFPVRHHSPACALQLQRLFAARGPSMVLVEGPASFTPLIPALTAPEAQAPLAIYTYAVLQGGQRHAAYYPFCDYSPELLALREARRLGIPARFVDLDFVQQLRFSAAHDDGPDSGGRSLLDERHYRHSRYLAELASRAGCRDHEELWEHLFEQPAPGLALEQHVANVAAYCALARANASSEELMADGTLAREDGMAARILSALSERRRGDGPVVAVLGGFHAVAMPALLQERRLQAGRFPQAAETGVLDAADALIRYSFERLDRLNGYAAGITSPGWHQRIWDLLQKHERAGVAGKARVRQEAALSTLYELAAQLRESHGVAVPMPALAAAYEQALGLAALRGRSGPVRDDVMDAVTSCYIKGDADAEGRLVRQAAQRLMCGERMGTAPPGGAAPPLVRDVEQRALRLRLKLQAGGIRRVVLDIYRRSEHRATSRLLHGLALLEVPFAVRTAGPDFVAGHGLERLQEHWEYAYTPMTEAALVEASVYGMTLPQAVASRYAAQLQRLHDNGAADAAAAAGALAQGCVLGLHAELPRVLALLRQSVAADARYERVTSAAVAIALLWEAREPLEARHASELPLVLGAAYERAIYLATASASDPAGGAAGSSGGGAAHDAQASALMRLRELLASEAGRGLDAALFWNMAQHAFRRHPSAMLRGAAAGVLFGGGYLDDAALAASLRGHLEGLLAPPEAVAFLRGLLSSAREAAWQLPALLESVNGMLARWPEAEFIGCLPELRLAFAAMTPRETGRIAEAVAALHGGQSLGQLVHHGVTERQLQANLALSQAVRTALEQDGLAGWGAGHD
ncbi:hypothetical protein ASD15_09700 [Massilia sp. Root351]|jgi:hypothetical protein|uniref:DUF5682 family protein n=1 Tax=Massilia sp. Root351 TaxID=1736522 RepID=UPI0007092322|nr:DUF5682 family protein [Massilia sp. Root351]KQV82311.1 hypothetical protein ASD15_09700 [Massilia sp. Root351]